MKFTIQYFRKGKRTKPLTFDLPSFAKARKVARIAGQFKGTSVQSFTITSEDGRPNAGCICKARGGGDSKGVLAQRNRQFGLRYGGLRLRLTFAARIFRRRLSSGPRAHLVEVRPVGGNRSAPNRSGYLACSFIFLRVNGSVLARR
jgi:hypothetical protein